MPMIAISLFQPPSVLQYPWKRAIENNLRLNVSKSRELIIHWRSGFFPISSPWCYQYFILVHPWGGRSRLPWYPWSCQCGTCQLLCVSLCLTHSVIPRFAASSSTRTSSYQSHHSIPLMLLLLGGSLLLPQTESAYSSGGSGPSSKGERFICFTFSLATSGNSYE